MKSLWTGSIQDSSRIWRARSVRWRCCAPCRIAPSWAGQGAKGCGSGGEGLLPLRLLRHRLGRLAGRVGIAQVIAAERLQVVVQLVDERDAGGDVQPHDLLVRDVVQMLHQ